ncbi:hydroxamate siderophore iron reductase FhuF [Erwinia sp. OLTSP20]|uniref:siderophore-iron reductase FhuF n=1 Tax=unclassified Erwinia TaxID=2622719 RepID=UPI000C191D7C|nr:MULTISPECIES: siderophore-iron reductase FhuF [unclassified Erwinia]PIJ50248.1 hydroxamate siderophore iron reductase FhuF [Erwinia sp. OAMSP11]PIJ72086.1 hydroxamate siderophore iron reductase FhuF [Erwinia sp. OLSSP12]PIJ81377.1 hydroxamate siderophore iron reductase FhuF [Erwinia sp. OLCASP19]PIJ84083.1 hydroxamate siderophore iron reductase FhuF [Erwinia sp. OLMTSP26]PIJ85782.1 hydroxamate siderophore iron reductase FhuF [Erwinia sp. OLMDSP33]
MAIVNQKQLNQHNDSLIFVQHDPVLAASLHQKLKSQQPSMLDTFRFCEAVPQGCMTLAHWSQPATFRHHCQRYADFLYRHHPQAQQQAKPLQSLWAQWYFGLCLPPLMLMLLQEERAIDCHPGCLHLTFHETGRPQAFWCQVQEDQTARFMSPACRLGRLIERHLMPVIKAIERLGDINARLIWNNTGFLMHWLLADILAPTDATQRAELEHMLFFCTTLPGGGNNPLYRTVIPRQGIMQRRSCCQRYRIPGIERCGDCTLQSAGTE